MFSRRAAAATILIMLTLLCSKVQAQRPEGTHLLLGFWSAEHQDNRARPGLIRLPDGVKYFRVRNEGFIFKPDGPEFAATVPLWAWYDARFKETHTTSDPEWDGDRPGAPPVERFGHPTLLGRVFDPVGPQPTGTLPLITWYSPSRKDYYTTTHPSWRGLPGDQRLPDYAFWRLEGYIYAPPGESSDQLPRFSVRRSLTVTIDRVWVHDDCDAISDGEWLLKLLVRDLGDLRALRGEPDLVREGAIWGGGIQNVYDRKDFGGRRTKVTIPQVPVDNQVEVGIIGYDCDEWGDPIFGFPPCGDEEVEPTGHHDSLGRTFILLDPERWGETTSLEITSEPGTFDCADVPPFRVDVTVTPGDRVVTRF